LLVLTLGWGLSAGAKGKALKKLTHAQLATALERLTAAQKKKPLSAKQAARFTASLGPPHSVMATPSSTNQLWYAPSGATCEGLRLSVEPASEAVTGFEIFEAKDLSRCKLQKQDVDAADMAQ